MALTYDNASKMSGTLYTTAKPAACLGVSLACLPSLRAPPSLHSCASASGDASCARRISGGATACACISSAALPDGKGSALLLGLSPEALSLSPEARLLTVLAARAVFKVPGHVDAAVSTCIRQDTSGYVSISQHTPANVSIRQETSANGSIRH